MYDVPRLYQGRCFRRVWLVNNPISSTASNRGFQVLHAIRTHIAAPASVHSPAMHPPTRMGRGPSRIHLTSEDVSRVKTPEDEDKDCVWISWYDKTQSTTTVVQNANAGVSPEVKLKDAKLREDTGLRLRSSSNETYGTLDNGAAQVPPTFNTVPHRAQPNLHRDPTEMPNLNGAPAPGLPQQPHIRANALEANTIDDENSGVLPEETWIVLFAVMVFILFLALIYFGLGLWAIVTQGSRVVDVVRRWASGVDVSRINGHG